MPDSLQTRLLAPAGLYYGYHPYLSIASGQSGYPLTLPCLDPMTRTISRCRSSMASVMAEALALVRLV